MKMCQLKWGGHKERWKDEETQKIFSNMIQYKRYALKGKQQTRRKILIH
jgi:hypothetical protein